MPGGSIPMAGQLPYQCMAIAILEAGYFMKYSGSSALLKRILENFCNNANLWAIDPSVLLPRGHDRLLDNQLQRHRRLLRAHPPSGHDLPANSGEASGGPQCQARSNTHSNGPNLFMYIHPNKARRNESIYRSKG